MYTIGSHPSTQLLLTGIRETACFNHTATLTLAFKISGRQSLGRPLTYPFDLAIHLNLAGVHLLSLIELLVSTFSSLRQLNLFPLSTHLRKTCTYHRRTYSSSLSALPLPNPLKHITYLIQM